MSQDLVSTLLPVVLIGVICLGIGGLAGFLLAGLQRPEVKADPKRNRSLVEAVRLWRDRRSESLWVETGGQMFESVRTLSAGQRAELSDLLDEMQTWLGVDNLVQRITPLPPVATPPPVAAPLPVAAPVLPPVQDFATPRTVPLTPAAPPFSVSGVETAPPVKPPTMADILARAVISEKKEIAPPKSIAAQVNEIVEETLPVSPFADRTIKLTELPGRGLVVQVDDKEFDGVGEVDDPAVQAFLRGCVAEWERRTEAKKK